MNGMQIKCTHGDYLFLIRHTMIKSLNFTRKVPWGMQNLHIWKQLTFQLNKQMSGVSIKTVLYQLHFLFFTASYKIHPTILKKSYTTTPFQVATTPDFINVAGRFRHYDEECISIDSNSGWDWVYSGMAMC